MSKIIGFVVTVLLLLAGGFAVHADDTEIFSSQYLLGAGASARPKVLIILDNSGSMSTTVPAEPTPYDRTITYPQVGSIRAGRIYWTDRSNPPSSGTDQWFYETKNRCATSFTPLGVGGLGFYQDNVLRWRSDEWRSLSDNENNPPHVECRADVLNANTDNGPGVTTGFPSDRNGPYRTSTDVNWDDSYKLYSANYMNWYHGAQVLVDRTRIDIAKEVLTDLIEANQGVDFGLMMFNSNRDSSDNGGRVVHRVINNMSAGQRTSLVATIDGFGLDSATPLCETAFEASLYLGSDPVLYGDDDTGALPPRDLAAEASGVYDSPLSDCQYTYLILMTDGAPTRDNAADSAIETLAGKTCPSYGGTKSCLPTLAEHFFNTDLDGDASNGTQRALTYTIGFQTDQTLLEDTARLGGGVYYTANNATQLSQAFQGALLEILANDGAFNSPTVAVDTFNRTRSRDDLFMAMFEPKVGTRWPGNIKKLKVNVTSGTAEIRDANDNPAIDTVTGHILDSARTWWSPAADGHAVEMGGVGGLLALRDPATRTIMTNSGTSGAMEAFNTTNLTFDAFGLASAAELFTLFGVLDLAELTEVISWSSGVDINDEDSDGSIIDTRPWVLGDMLHSEPLAINYGALGSSTLADPDIRLVVGTNAAMLHMFGTSDGVEDWAFFPKELAPVLKTRLDNNFTNIHTYAIDGSPVAYTKDVNRDGTLSATDGDKVYVYFGLRRGGRAYYALDLSIPGTPVYKWMIDNNSTGFSELGQSWSKPVVSYVPGYVDGSGNHKPVLIFGGGFDAANKDGTGLATADTMGRAIYIVDADTGALVWSVSPAATVSPNLQETGLQHGIVAKLAVMDSNGDGVADRIYAPDTGGNIWRVDLPGTTRTDWRINKLAAFNGGDAANDRRFFSTPDIVRTQQGGQAFDAVLLGSGERNNPVATDVTNRSYMIKDKQVTPYYDANPTTAECVSSGTPGVRANDFRCKLPLAESDLFDATANLVQDGTAAQKVTAQGAINAASGWYITLERTGEKSLAKSITIDGSVVFTTFAPEVANVNVCVPEPGQAYLYAVNLFDASAVYNFDGSAGLEKADRVAQMGTMILNTPSAHVGEDARIRLIFPAGGTSGSPVAEMDGSIFDTQNNLSGAKGTYWYQEEY